MKTAMEQRACGTVSCIGGTMALIMGCEPWSYIHRIHGIGHSPALRTLFFPPLSRDWSFATPAVAVRAIDHWLKTGRPGWVSLLPKKTDD